MKHLISHVEIGQGVLKEMKMLPSISAVNRKTLGYSVDRN